LRDGGSVGGHVVLENVGTFLHLYGNRSAASMPLGDINVAGAMVFRGDSVTRSWLVSTILPLTWDTIRDAAAYYVINVHNIDFSGVVRLSDLVDLRSSIERFGLTSSHTVEPFGAFGDGSLFVHSLGEDFGVLLDPDFVATLDSIDDVNGAFISIDTGFGGIHSVGILANLVTLRSYNTTLSEVSLRDMGTSELYVNLMSGELVKLSNVSGTMTVSAGTYEENRIIKDEIAVVKLADAVVATPSKYTEVVTFMGVDLPTGVTVDISNMLDGKTGVELSSGVVEDFKTYVDGSGLVRTSRSNRSGFLIYSSPERIPYERLLAFLVSDDAGLFLDDDGIQSMLAGLESVYTDSGRAGEWRELEIRHGLRGSGGVAVFLYAGVFVIGLLGVGWFSYKKIKKRKGGVEVMFNIKEGGGV